MENILWQAHNLPAVKSVKSVVILWGKNKVHLMDAPKDIVNSIIEIGSTFKGLYSYVNIYLYLYLYTYIYLNPTYLVITTDQ